MHNLCTKSEVHVFTHSKDTDDITAENVEVL